MRRTLYWLTVGVTFALASCAGAPLRLYTLSDRTGSGPVPSPEARPTVIEIERVSIPAELDNEDILVREGSSFRRSTSGRWASQLSLQVTDLVARRLAHLDPAALVTTGSEAGPPSYRLQIRITQLDLQSDGSVHLAADWALIPEQAGASAEPGSTDFTISGSVGTDGEVVMLVKKAVARLTHQIGPPPGV